MSLKNIVRKASVKVKAITQVREFTQNAVDTVAYLSTAYIFSHEQGSQSSHYHKNASLDIFL